MWLNHSLPNNPFLSPIYPNLQKGFKILSFSFFFLSPFLSFNSVDGGKGTFLYPILISPLINSSKGGRGVWENGFLIAH
jgi:hypothetical protein